jgi:hypothetical protein
MSMLDAFYVLLFLIVAFITARVAMWVVMDRLSRFKERRRRR